MHILAGGKCLADAPDRVAVGIRPLEEAAVAAEHRRFHGKGASHVRLVSEVGSVGVSPDLAAPVGIIVTEFITNSLKYAFGDGSGAIGIRLEELEPGRARLMLWDDGKGCPKRGRAARVCS